MSNGIPVTVDDSQSPNSESEFEEMLIDHLQHIGGSKQWDYRPDIKTTNDLWQNFRHILERNNTGKLAGQPLTDSEFDEIKRIVVSECSSPYKAAQWIYGLNGVTQIEIQRDNADDDSPDGSSHTVFLTVFDQSQVGAGNTTYQIVNQIEREPVQAGMPSRRFDTTLLINGLPFIQIEEKAANHDVREALRQEQRYISEGQYGDIFSTLQILIGMTPYDCMYMANTDADHFNLDFAFRWQTETGDPVFNWKQFTDLVLSIPMAHQMATSFMIMDGSRNHEKLIVMRPYQVYATKRVIHAIKQHDFSYRKATGIGYVWHTTGSGKTITSFKTAWLASRLPNIDKVVFLVDRIALTRQTYEKYQAYDPDSSDDTSGVIADTRNVFDLARKLRSKNSNNSIIVTSIQKMGDLCKRQDFPEVSKHTVFICDEAHRSTNGQMLTMIRDKFPFSAWVGYTGTPIFDDDTTANIFGPCLHSYTIRQGIADKNVLGFKVDFERTLETDEAKDKLLPVIFKGKHPSWSDDQIRLAIARIEPEEVDSYIDSGIYDNNDRHVKAVVKNILDHWENRSVQGRYSALLTTHVRRGTSTPMAMKYFEEFIKQNKQRESRGLKPLTVAVTFSSANNNESTQKKNNADLKRATDVYDEEFGTNFHEDSVKEYFADVAARLSGDDPGTGNDNARRLNLVIVVDQLLTGFDAPTLNTLYVDRTLSGASLIQAYSRTNRIEDNQYKPFGRIVNFRYPETSKELMNDALRLYANSSSAVIKNDQSSSSSDMSDAPLTDVIARPWNDVVEDTKQIIERLRTLTKDFTDLNPTDETVRKQSLNLCASFNKNLSILKQDENFDYSHPEQLKKQLGITDEDKKIKSIEFIITDQTQSDSNSDDPTRCTDPQPALDLDFHVEHIGEERVNYSYLQKLLADYLNAQSTHEPNSETRLANLQDAAGQYEDRQQAHRLMNLASVAQNSESGKIPGVDYPIKVDDIPRLVDKNNKDQASRQILQFRTKWGLNDIDNAKRIIDDLIRNHSPHADDLKGQELNALLEAVTRQRLYPTDAQDNTIKNMSVFRYRSALTHALQELADSIVEQTPNFDNSDQAN